MGRTFPMTNEMPLDHHHPSLSLLLGCMAAVFAITAIMCGARFRKKHKSEQEAGHDTSPSPPPQDKQETLGSTTSTPTSDTITTKKATSTPTIATITTTIGGDGEDISRPLPPPPAAIAIDRVPLDHMKKRKKLNIDKSSSLNTYISSKRSRRRLSTGSIGIRMPVGRSTKRKERKGEDEEPANETPRSKQEDSLWTKKILLGEKCRFHEEDKEAAGPYVVKERGKWVCNLVRVDEDVKEDVLRSDSSASSSEEPASKDKESDMSCDVVFEQV